MNVLIKEVQPITAIGIQQFLKNKLEINDVEICHTLEEVNAVLTKRRIDLLILDTSSPFEDTNTLIRTYTKAQNNLNILIYGDKLSEKFEFQYISAGASGFITKGSSGDELNLAIDLICNGKLYLSKQALNRGRISFNKAIKSPLKKLSKREYQVFKELIKGNSVNGISEALKLKQSTVSSFKRRIMTKCQVNNLAELIKFSYSYNMEERITA